MYFGCVGNDEFSKRMREVAEEEGLVVDYLINKETPTGTCAAIITDNNR